jgi:hypothetical protein
MIPEIIKENQPISPYLFIFLGFNLATVALLFTLNLSIPKNLLERLHNHIKEQEKNARKSEAAPESGTSTKPETSTDRSQEGSILYYFYWIDFITFCWLITLLSSIFSVATLILVKGQLNLCSSMSFIRSLLIIGICIHGYILIKTSWKVKKERKKRKKICPNGSQDIPLISNPLFACIAVFIILMSFWLIYLSWEWKPNGIIATYIFVFCIYLGACFLAQYRLMPITALMRLWDITKSI